MLCLFHLGPYAHTCHVNVGTHCPEDNAAQKYCWQGVRRKSSRSVSYCLHTPGLHHLSDYLRALSGHSHWKDMLSVPPLLLPNLDHYHTDVLVYDPNSTFLVFWLLPCVVHTCSSPDFCLFTDSKCLASNLDLFCLKKFHITVFGVPLQWSQEFQESRLTAFVLTSRTLSLWWLVWGYSKADSENSGLIQAGKDESFHLGWDTKIWKLHFPIFFASEKCIDFTDPHHTPNKSLTTWNLPAVWTRLNLQ